MLTNFQTSYLFFYLAGRDEPSPRNLKLDLEEIAQKAIAGPSDVHTVIRAAVELAMKPFEQGAKRKEFLADNEDEIFSAGGDGDVAYQHYLQGRIDQHTYKITNPVLDAMTAEVCDEGGEEDEDDEEIDEAADDAAESEDEHPDEAEGDETAS